LKLVVIPGSGDLREIPTVPTNFEEIQKQATEALAKLDRIDLNKMVASITNAADSINSLTGSQDLKDTLASLRQTVPNVPCEESRQEGTSRIKCQGPDSLISKVELAARLTETAPCLLVLLVSFISFLKMTHHHFPRRDVSDSGISIVRPATTSLGDCSNLRPDRRSGSSFCPPDSRSRMCRSSLLLQRGSRLAKRLLWRHLLRLLQDR